MSDAPFVISPNLSSLVGVSTAALLQTAPRPLQAGLAIQKLLRLHPDLRMRTVAEGLEDCAAEILAATVR